MAALEDTLVGVNMHSHIGIGHTRWATHGEPSDRNAVSPTLSDDVLVLPAADEILAPMLNVIPLQLLAYHICVAKGYDVDKPRNLAKSVTVE